MADISTPVLCVACRQSVPETIKEISYFAGSALRPEADEVETFVAEVGELAGYIEVLFILLSNVNEGDLDEGQLNRAHQLGWSLATEARHRVELASEAVERRQQRLE